MRRRKVEKYTSVLSKGGGPLVQPRDHPKPHYIARLLLDTIVITEKLRHFLLVIIMLALAIIFQVKGTNISIHHFLRHRDHARQHHDNQITINKSQTLKTQLRQP